MAVKLSIIGKPPSNQTSSKRVTHAAESSARIILTFKRHFRQDYEQYDATFSPAPEEELDYYAVYELEGDLDRRDNYISIYVSKVDTIIFDDAHRNFKKSISLLVSCGVLHKGNPGTRIGEPIRSLVKAVLILSKQIRTSLRTGDAPGQDFLGFFDDFGFPVDDQSLSVLEEVIQAEMDEKQRLLEERNGAGQEEEDKFFRWLLECQPDPDPEPETRTTVFVFRSGGLIETALV